jgi:membrane-bound lytic murein transglycosylase D
MKKCLLLMILAALLLSYCGGNNAKPATEPVQPSAAGQEPEATVPPQQVEEQTPAPENTTAETTEAPGTIENQTEPAPSTTADGRDTPLESPKPEKIPVIKPQQQIPTDIKPLNSVIVSGITGIFREFGYTGDIDVPENFQERVGYYIGYFSSNETGSRYYLRAMSRGSQYLPMIKRIFKEKHLPLSLAYLPVVESGYSPNARSRAGAVGMWQFMKGTARMYGLKITRTLDERTDPVKSTYAAAEYLNDLLAMFGSEDPFLGICAFNAGEGKILNSLRKISFTERSFWTLVKKNLLQSETDEYIPQLMAVILMANHPDRYAVASPPASLAPEELTAVEEEDQETIDTLHHTDIKEDVEEAVKPVKPPAAKKTSDAATAPQTYRVKRGDNLYRIASRHHIKVSTLKQWNGLRSNRIYVGQRLKIYPTGIKTGKSTQKKVSHGYKLVYTVNYTDSLARIALFFKGVSARDIMRWNRLRRSRIHPKQRLVLYLEESPRKVLTHTVKRGETAFHIARKYGLRVEFVLSLNGLVTNSPLKPGQKLKIYFF